MSSVESTQNFFDLFHQYTKRKPKSKVHLSISWFAQNIYFVSSNWFVVLKYLRNYHSGNLYIHLPPDYQIFLTLVFYWLPLQMMSTFSLHCFHFLVNLETIYRFCVQDFFASVVAFFAAFHFFSFGKYNILRFCRADIILQLFMTLIKLRVTKTFLAQ